MIKLSDLQIKEVIVVDSGERLGHIHDLQIDPDLGRITAIIIIVRENKQGLFGKPEERIVFWDQIVTIGMDVILVTDVAEPQRYPESDQTDLSFQENNSE
ncbi:MAG TPA: YlmC/YmxH family sporulation protein [Virgibacillus sp.]|nr:YlmC/YmxH family sporulation protein [Virgibacillus sp.]